MTDKEIFYGGLISEEEIREAREAEEAAEQIRREAGITDQREGLTEEELDRELEEFAAECREAGRQITELNARIDAHNRWIDKQSYLQSLTVEQREAWLRKKLAKALAKHNERAALIRVAGGNMEHREGFFRRVNSFIDFVITVAIWIAVIGIALSAASIIYVIGFIR